MEGSEKRLDGGSDGECISSCAHVKRCIVFLVPFLQHGNLSEAVTAVLDFPVNSFFWAPVLDMLFINFTMREKLHLDFLKMYIYENKMMIDVNLYLKEENEEIHHPGSLRWVRTP